MSKITKIIFLLITLMAAILLAGLVILDFDSLEGKGSVQKEKHLQLERMLEKLQGVADYRVTIPQKANDLPQIEDVYSRSVEITTSSGVYLKFDGMDWVLKDEAKNLRGNCMISQVDSYLPVCKFGKTTKPVCLEALYILDDRSLPQNYYNIQTLVDDSSFLASKLDELPSNEIDAIKIQADDFQIFPYQAYDKATYAALESVSCWKEQIGR